MLGSVLNCGVRRSEFRFLPFHRRHKRPPTGPFCTPRRKARRRVAPQVDSAQCRPHEPNAAGAELNRTRRIWPKCQRRPTNALEVSRTHVYVVGA